MHWKETVTTLTEKVIPGLSSPKQYIFDNEVLSNLQLQMALYFNVVFFPVWLVIIMLLLYDKYNCYDEFTKFVITTILIATVTIEVLRLYLGYEGNLRDKIPEMAGFWMLSILLQFPMQGFLLFNPHFEFTILEIIVQSVMFLLLLTELMAGYCALRFTSKQQAIYFKIMKSRKEKPKLL